jgi:hypothetical protein
MKQIFLMLALEAIGLCSCTTHPSITTSVDETTWKGHWRSSELPLVHGTMVAAFPAAIPSEKDFGVRARIRYSPVSLYRPGQTVDVQFDARQSYNRQVSGSNTESPISGRIGGGSLLSLKGTVFNSIQTISYQGVFESGVDKVRGEYESNMPFDRGRFQLKAKK